ncbi:uncharacterized protein EAE98_011486 [Botrytis deweyae]|uniref:Peptidase A1 domain-containing protein n=1 Tax=Botrytis deweyae TaxID=2478750 RepID=A0ABQ7I5N7_9HELO|nr:uncharacterized protein EAE98_011486 [Botrytis deweyae]KAF7913461.1 hypothetical protein EAE98_011486 [Botrytis deweyae]
MARLFWIGNSVVFAIILFFAWPTLAANGRRSFSVHQISRADTSQLFNISKAFARNVFRYGGQRLPNAVKSAETATVLTWAQDREFLIPVSVGASTLNLTIDTGSSDLWVFSSQLPEDQREGHAVYKPSVYASKSSTQTWKIWYADGSHASGGLCHDVQAVEIATNVSNNLVHSSRSDGVLGLGFSNLNKGIFKNTDQQYYFFFELANLRDPVRPERENTFFDNAKLQLKLPLFAAILKEDTPGSYDFGFINKSKYIYELVYVEVDSSRGHWNFKLSGYDLGDGEIVNDLLDSVIDTGASLIFLPENIVRAYYQQAIGAEYNAQFGEWTIPCSSFLPSFTPIIKGYNAKVKSGTPLSGHPPFGPPFYIKNHFLDLLIFLLIFNMI